MCEVRPLRENLRGKNENGERFSVFLEKKSYRRVMTPVKDTSDDWFLKDIDSQMEKADNE